MKPLVVRLPSISHCISGQRKSNRLEQRETKTLSKSAGRVAEWRRKQRENPVMMEAMKQKKKIENEMYKSKMRALRKSNEAIDKQLKRDQRKWQRHSRNRRKPVALTPQKPERPASTSGIRKTVERVNQKLPSSPNTWAKVVGHIIRNSTPKRRSLLDEKVDKNIEHVEVEGINKVGRPTKLMSEIKKKLAFSETATSGFKSKHNLRRYKKRVSMPKQHKAQTSHQYWHPKIVKFLDANSRMMPNKKDTLLIEGVRVAKRHLLMTKYKAYLMFKDEHRAYNRSFKTFVKKMPKQYKRLDLTCRRVCVCTKDYNLDQKIEALQKAAVKIMPNLKFDRRSLSDISLCQPVSRKCIDRQCDECGTEKISTHLRPLCETSDPSKLHYTQWEICQVQYKEKTIKKWKQLEKLATVEELISLVKSDMEDHSGHIYRSDYQHRVERDIAQSLPMSHCLAVLDFSENITLFPQDEIESAHWTQTQVTLHPVHIVRHSPNSTTSDPVLMTEAFIIISDRLVHDARAVYTFTQKVLRHIEKNPGPSKIDVLHRFSDNCAVQYKCAEAFAHLPLYMNQNVKVFYHYTESGHGKGPSDGLGATTKRKLDRLILGGKIVTNAYQAYLALTQNEVYVQRKNGDLPRNHTFVYVPAQEIEKYAPKLGRQKTIKGTQKFHMVRILDAEQEVIVCDDLSCSCNICLGVEQGPCYFAQFRHSTKFVHLSSAKEVTTLQQVNTEDQHYTALTDAILESILTEAEEREKFENAVAKLTQSLSVQGWRICGQTPSDGNCFFWAASDQIDRTHSQHFTHKQLRRKTIHHLQTLSDDKKSELCKFVEGNDLQQYIATMKKDGEYADHIAIKALSETLPCTIHIMETDQPESVIGDDGPHLVLGYISEIMHYVSLERMPTGEREICDEDFVIVELEYRKAKQYYIAKVIKYIEEQDMFTVRYLRPRISRNNSTFTWPVVNDVSDVSSCYIVKKLCPPSLLPGRGLKMKFKENELSQF